MSQALSGRSFFKDLQILYKKIEDSTEGEASIVGGDDLSVMISLQPTSGLNAHAVFHLTVRYHCQSRATISVLLTKYDILNKPI